MHTKVGEKFNVSHATLNPFSNQLNWVHNPHRYISMTSTCIYCVIHNVYANFVLHVHFYRDKKKKRNVTTI